MTGNENPGAVGAAGAFGFDQLASSTEGKNTEAAYYTQVGALTAECEQRVLGCMLKYGAVAIDAFNAAGGAGYISDPLHQRIASQICSAHAEGVPTDPLAIQLRMGGDPGLAEIQNPEYLSTISLAAPACGSPDDVRKQMTANVGTLVRAAFDQAPEEFGEIGETETFTHDSDEPRAPEFSDDALALTFAELNKDHLRYVHLWGKWFAWGGQRWVAEDTLKVFDLVRMVCRRAAEAAKASNLSKFAMGVASGRTVAAVEKLARCDRKLAATTEQWDADPWPLNTPGGVVDLRDGTVRAHSLTDYMTKMTAVAPGGDCPLFRQFMNCVTGGDFDLELYLGRVFGYAATGSTKEHALFFFYGTGGNGKSVLLNTVSNVLGGYAKTAPMETFTASRHDRHPTELAALQGARLVTAMETEQGRYWAEAKIKTLTGGEKIPARFMRQDFFEFAPQFKLVIAGNHKPRLRSVDEAIKRRMNLIPFTVTIPKAERDPDLAEKLKAEWPGILRWLIDGCLEWQKLGLQPPAAVTDATAAYLEAEDSLSGWLAECCETGHADHRQKSSELWASWRQWAEAAGEDVRSQKWFAQSLETREFKSRHARDGTWYFGIRLTAPSCGNG